MSKMLSIETLSTIAVVSCFDHVAGWLDTSSTEKVSCFSSGDGKDRNMDAITLAALGVSSTLNWVQYL